MLGEMETGRSPGAPTCGPTTLAAADCGLFQRPRAGGESDFRRSVTNPPFFLSFFSQPDHHQPLERAEAAEGCARAGIGSIGLWRDKVAEAGGPDAAARRCAPAGLDRLEPLPRRLLHRPRARSTTTAARSRRPRRSAPTYWCSSAAGCRRARATCRRRAPWSRTASRPCSTTPSPPASGSASSRCTRCSAPTARSSPPSARRRLAERLPDQVGGVINAYHVWWDPCVDEEIARARIFGFHIDDWVLPLPEGALLGRGLPGEGCADLSAHCSAPWPPPATTARSRSRCSASAYGTCPATRSSRGSGRFSDKSGWQEAPRYG